MKWNKKKIELLQEEHEQMEDQIKYHPDAIKKAIDITELEGFSIY